MATSKARAARRPSTPKIPIPTCAVWIMLSSLAPSPMANKIELVFFLTNLTTNGVELANVGDLEHLGRPLDIDGDRLGFPSLWSTS